MARIDSVLLKGFFYGLPLVIASAAYGYCYKMGIVNQAHGFLGLLNDLAGLLISLGMVLALYLSLRLMVSARFRDQVLSRLTLIRERDEREAMLTGQAARMTFLSTLAILIFILCLSCFQISIYKVAPENAVDGKTGVIALGFSVDLLSSPGQAGESGTAGKKDIFSYTGLPVSSTTVVLLLITWQILSYNLFMRRLTTRLW